MMKSIKLNQLLASTKDNKLLTTCCVQLMIEFNKKKNA